MASGKDFMEFVCEQLSDAGNITYRKMFGEYGVYCDGKFFGVVCDNQLFIKITQAGEERFNGLAKAPPYDGAKDYFLIDNIEDRALLSELIRISCGSLPDTKKRR